MKLLGSILALTLGHANGFSLSFTAKQQQNSAWKLDSTTLSDSDVLTDPMFIAPLDSSPENGKMSQEELINIAQRFLFTSKGLGGDPAMLAESFQFEGPVVGPLSKDAFVQAIGSVDFDTAFPNWTPQFYGFFVDPLEEKANRVWYTARGCGVNEGPLLPFAPEATSRMVENPPQVCSLTIDHDTGLITRYTIGYVTDRSVGNTGGLGGLYGILYALGKPLPFPEAQPWKMSWQYAFFQKLGSLLNR
mmetsp:Transcript_10979/g.16816  ORF Transcript_10979/g.16816 Transcript_10979/m.16816 type:complete len:247 (-) Transcript_10979:233-973(-)|eukprot:CAMPEP_0194222194 /NCGR_PEP_ID=MMETSP0156-20130528/32370_1 /TAXON_ID=33649 /ORGANISM="Thalassionema nitzschioides, Strain L26-B" /LENGTH=246 /DNA_ID=CAMNT_0038952883 /DNA_START=158 /DNA_END=898 /DNA_ORIENTATION=-